MLSIYTGPQLIQPEEDGPLKTKFREFLLALFGLCRVTNTRLLRKVFKIIYSIPKCKLPVTMAHLVRVVHCSTGMFVISICP